MEKEPTIKIDHNIKIPIQSNKYPWKGLKIGDSFFIECKNMDECISVQSSLLSNGKYWTRKYKNGWKFTTRKINGKGVRVWRIE